MDTDKLWRVLVTCWESGVYVETWCRTKYAADLIARLMRSSAAGLGDVTVQVDRPRAVSSRENER